MQIKNDFSEMKALIVGFGSIGKRHGDILKEIGVKHIACSDTADVCRDQFAAFLPGAPLYSDYETALSEFQPDAVFLCTPTKLHIPMAKTALMHDTNVFIEKPLCYSTDGALELDALAKEKGKKVMVGFCFRYHEALLKAKQMIDEGMIGRLISIRALMGEPFYQIHPEYMDMYYSKYSGTFELVHDLDLAIWFAGQKIKRVEGVYGSFSEMGMASPDIAELLVEFEDRLVANVHLDFFQFPRRRTIDLIGWDGVLQVEFASWDHAQLKYFTKETNEWKTIEFETKRNDMFVAEDSEFLRCIQTGEEVSINIMEGLKASAAIESVYKI